MRLVSALSQFNSDPKPLFGTHWFFSECVLYLVTFSTTSRSTVTVNSKLFRLIFVWEFSEDNKNPHHLQRGGGCPRSPEQDRARTEPNGVARLQAAHQAPMAFPSTPYDSFQDLVAPIHPCVCLRSASMGTQPGHIAFLMSVPPIC